MKLKYLLAACTAFFLVSCSNDDELPQPPQHGDIVGLNIKDAKYIYTSGTNTRSSAAQYRQIKKDGRDMELSWIDDKGDTIKINGNPKIWNINATYVMVSTETPINYKPSFDEDGNLIPLNIEIDPNGVPKNYYRFDILSDNKFVVKNMKSCYKTINVLYGNEKISGKYEIELGGIL